MASERRVTIAMGLALEVGLLVLLATGLDRGSYWLEIAFWLPFSIYAVSVWRLGRGGRQAEGSQSWALILAFALLFHVTLLFSPRPLSDDVFRYTWDGKVINAGFSPYALAPAANELRSLRDGNWQFVQNKPVLTMYPPVAQLLFAALYRLAPGTLAFRIAAVAFSMGAAAVLVLVLRELRLPVGRAAIYAWSPLVAIEFGNSGHIDSLAVLCAVTSFLFLLKGRRSLSALALALGVLTKVYPLLFAPLLCARWGRRANAVFFAVLALFCLPLLPAGTSQLGGFAYFMGHGLFNGSLFPLLLGGLQLTMDASRALLVAKGVTVGVYACMTAYLAWQARRRQAAPATLWRYAMWLTGVFLLLSPTVHPWYLTWMLPFLCVFPQPGWLLLTGTSIFARSVYLGFEANGAWQEQAWARLAEYVPPYLLMAGGAVRWALRRPATAGQTPESRITAAASLPARGGQ